MRTAAQGLAHNYSLQQRSSLAETGRTGQVLKDPAMTMKARAASAFAGVAAVGQGNTVNQSEAIAADTSGERMAKRKT